MSAILAMKRQQAPEKVMELLGESIDVHFASLKGQALSTDYYYMLNPNFLIQVVSDYLSFAPQKVRIAYILYLSTLVSGVKGAYNNSSFLLLTLSFAL